MEVDLIVRSDRIVRSEDVINGAIVVHNGRIVGITDGESDILPRAAETIDARGKVVMAGVIDPHVHVREPGTEEREDWITGTQAAAAGGVTTILEMPVCMPSVHSRETFLFKKELASKKSIIDFGLYGGAGVTSLDQITEQAEAGAIAFKTFMHEPYPDRINEFEGLYATDDGALYEVFERVAGTGLPECVHAEDNGIIESLTKRLRGAGRKDPLAYVEARPVFGEVDAIQRCLTFARASGVQLHIVHVSTADGVEAITAARRSGMRKVSCETITAFLMFDEKDVLRAGPYARISPPIRDAENAQRLWSQLRAREIHAIASDHGPHTKEKKERGWADIFNAPAGSAGIETMLPSMLTKVNEGAIDLHTVTWAMSENVARIFGLAPKKGRITVGADADLIVVDMNLERTLHWQDLHTKAKDAILLYDGMHLTGMPVTTIVRGRVVAKDGTVVGNPGYGEFLQRQR